MRVFLSRLFCRLFGNTGLCAACNKVIPAFEMVMRARSNVYHLECFACQQCNHRYVLIRRRLRLLLSHGVLLMLTISNGFQNGAITKCYKYDV